MIIFLSNDSYSHSFFNTFLNFISEIILVNKLDGPAIYQFISKGQQKTSEQGLSAEMVSQN